MDRGPPKGGRWRGARGTGMEGREGTGYEVAGTRPVPAGAQFHAGGSYRHIARRPAEEPADDGRPFGHAGALRDGQQGATCPNGIKHGTASAASSSPSCSSSPSAASPSSKRPEHSLALDIPMQQIPPTSAASPRHLRALQRHLGLPKRRAASQNVLAA
ncbi:hypothetical protein CCMA1212_002576 [Trichoderma ghanense]|uniref:Uncharacterized protein n=1 Tax=Trichoderma ghanense TaxID=65468 RepID=A0ABY2HC04_9HYPO